MAELISDDPHSRPSAQEILNHELFYEVSSRRGTASSFGGSGTESPLSNELDLFYSSLQTGFRRRSGETPGTRTDSASGHRLSLRNSKSVISLEFDQRRRRRTTADETYGAWAPFGFGDEPEPMRSGPHLTIDQHGQQDSITEGELLSIPDGFYQSPIAGQSRSVGMDNGPNNLISSSSHIPHSDFSRPTDVDATGLDSKDRIRSLERDVALLEAKLRAMTAHSLLLESELESRDIDAQSKSPGSPPSSVLCGFPIRLSSSPGQHRHSFPVGVPYGASPVSFQTSHSVAMSRNASGDSSHPITIPTPPSRPSRH